MDIGIKPDVSRTAYVASIKVEETTAEEALATEEKKERIPFGIQIDK